jgi:hypothetical protein
MELPMTKTTPTLFAATLLASSLGAAPAQALTFRTFVSAHGSDANPCTLTAPCRTFAAAHAQTSPGGIIDVLDPAGYGALTITKSISIIGRDWASVLVTSANGISVNAGAGDVVNLRGLIIDGAGTASSGIDVAAVGTLIVENSVIRRFSNNGVNYFPSTSTKFIMSDTLVSNNGIGIGMVPGGAGTTTATFNRVQLADNSAIGLSANGILGTGVIKVTVADSVASGNTTGFVAQASAGQATVAVMLVRCVAANNNGGGMAVDGAAATMRVAQSTVTGNGTGWSITNSGTLLTYGDNNVDGNGTEVSGTPSPLTTR